MRERITNRGPVVALVALTALLGLNAYAYVFEPRSELTVFLSNHVFDNMMLAAGGLCLWRGLRTGQDRPAWILFALSLLSWGIGDTVWTYSVQNDRTPPYPSAADIGFLGVYPFAYAAIGSLVHRRVRGMQTTIWLDGVIGALAVSAAGTALVFPAILAALGGSSAAIATNLAYPLGDLTLIGLVVWSFSILGWRPGREWFLVGAGLVVFSISDCLYLVETAAGTYVNGTASDLGWIGGGLLIAWAAWQPPRSYAEITVTKKALLAAPTGFGLLALAVLIVDRIDSLTVLASVLAGLALLAVIARLGLTVAENLRMLTSSRIEARTDALTGLPNRRCLLEDLERWEPDGRPEVIVTLDLNGFKSYNDTFGHLAGDALLGRLAGNLGLLAASCRGRAYRVGGDEFWLVAPESVGLLPHELGRAASVSLTETGQGFDVTAAFGTVAVPREADTVGEALRLADERMYADKQSRRGSTSDQSSAVLVGALVERDRDLADHGGGVGELAVAVAEHLDLLPFEVERTRLAAILHDVGKLAIPDAILRKPEPLDDEEWNFVRQHTVIGERILLAAPALTDIARIVRATHERFDGSGYPDGRSGTEIPLPARIVFACDAYDAMISDRPYSPAVTVEQAVAELRACAGTQFDPAIVAAISELVGLQSATRNGRQIAV